MKGCPLPRASRLLDLIQLLRGHRYPVSGMVLASRLGISLRTLYRDVATLQAQGAHIEGEAGVGFMLRPGYMLPPLMFSEDEIEALVLGAQFVAERADSQLALAARTLLAKISAVLPENARFGLESGSLLVAPASQDLPMLVDLADIRRSIRSQRKLDIGYLDAKGQRTQRIIWPFALGFFDAARMVAAWCEQRGDFRHFRCDRIVALQVLPQAYLQKRGVLLKRWKAAQGIAGNN